ncbi:MAG: SURF1 family protein [Burkholderiaceae bacterium]
MLAIIGGTAALGNWQLNRAEYKRQLEQLRETAARTEPTRLGIAPLQKAPSIEGHPFVVSGDWQSEKTIFIDNRSYQGVAGFHVVSAFRIHRAGGVTDDSAQFVLVLRGWVPADRGNRNRVPGIVFPTGLQTIRGLAEVALPQAMQLGPDVEPGPDDVIWQYFDVAKFRRWSGLPTHGFVLRQTSELDDGLIRDWPQPGNDVDRHNGYAFQWFAMSATASIFLLWLIIRAALGRRRRRAVSGSASESNSDRYSDRNSDPDAK